MQDKDLPILHNQYHGCWRPGDARNQGISKHDIYDVELDQFGPHTIVTPYGVLHQGQHWLIDQKKKMTFIVVSTYFANCTRFPCE